MRSMRSVRSSRIERCIWAMPLSRPDVQTLVAMKALSRVPAAASRSPTTPSAAPYIGELSITEPPASNNDRSTSTSGARCCGDAPTSKVAPCAAADDGQALAGRRDRALMHAALRA